MKVLDPALKTIVHIPNVNSRESTKDKHNEVDDIMDALGTWKGGDPATGFHLHRAAQTGGILKVADLVDDRPGQARPRLLAALKDPARRKTATTSTSSSRSAWPRKASTGFGASTR